DAVIAAALDRGADSAHRRGAHDLAAGLLEHAVRLTPPDDAGWAQRRRLEAANRHFEAGHVSRASEVVAQLLESTPAGVERARVVLLAAMMRVHSEGL